MGERRVLAEAGTQGVGTAEWVPFRASLLSFLAVRAGDLGPEAGGADEEGGLFAGADDSADGDSPDVPLVEKGSAPLPPSAD